MKYALLLFSALACSVYADDEMDFSATADDVKIIQYTVTLYKDSSKDEAQWRVVRDKAIDTVQRGHAGERDIVLDSVIQSLQALMIDGANVHGDITVALSSGECDRSICGDTCGCAEKYRGLCPCSLEVKKGNVCCGNAVLDNDSQLISENSSSSIAKEDSIGTCHSACNS